MSKDFPLVSIIIPTYNRAKTIKRALNSALNQSFPQIEIIIVDDGSTDNTVEILKYFNDPRIRILKHEKNKGVTAAKNTGLRNIKGEWFTILDSDDEIVSDAIEVMLNKPLYFDNSITAVSCNCIDTSTGSFSGKGLNNDQYLDVETLMTLCKGEHWGLTKTSLLMNDYFNENLNGLEGTLWTKIDDRAKRYYIHKALRVYHTEGQDRISISRYNSNKEIKHFVNLIDESFYLEKLKKYKPDYFIKTCRSGLIITRAAHHKNIALAYYNYINSTTGNFINKAIYRFWLAAFTMKNLKVLKRRLYPYLHFFKNRITKAAKI